MAGLFNLNLDLEEFSDCQDFILSEPEFVEFLE